MKKYLLLLLSISAMTAIQAQTDSTAQRNEESKIMLHTGGKGLNLEVQTIDTVTGELKDTTRLQIGTHSVLIVNDAYEPEEKDEEEVTNKLKKKLTHWNGIDIGYNNYFNDDNTYGARSEDEHLEVDVFRSRMIGFNFGETKLRLIKDYVGIYTGAAIQYNSYKLKNDFTLIAQDDSLTAFRDSSINLNKNKLRTAWVSIPLMLEFNTSLHHSRNFHFAAGAVGGYNFGTMYKQKLKVGGARDKVKSKGDYYVNPFKLDAMVRAGYGGFTLFASYQVTEMFDPKTAPRLHPVSLGLSILF